MVTYIVKVDIIIVIICDYVSFIKGHFGPLVGGHTCAKKGHFLDLQLLKSLERNLLLECCMLRPQEKVPVPIEQLGKQCTKSCLRIACHPNASAETTVGWKLVAP